MSQTKARNKPLVVLDFVCDHCGLTIDMIVLAQPGVPKQLVSTLHKECWSQNVKPSFNFRSAGAN